VSWTLKLAGNTRTEVLVNSVRIDLGIGRAGTASFQTSDVTASLIPWPGQEVEILFDGVTVFGGIVIAPEWTYRKAAGTRDLFCTVQVVDYSLYLQRHVIGAKVYEGMSLYEIVSDIWTYANAPSQALSNEGLTINAVANPGPTISRLVVKHALASEIFKTLSQLTGYWMWVDFLKDIHMQPAAGEAAAFGIDESTNICTEITCSFDSSQKRNRQYVRTPDSLAAYRTETFVGDGATQSFYTSFPLAAEPTIDVDGTPQTVGVFGVDSGKQWYWLEGAAVIHQDFGDPPLDSPAVLTVIYQDFGRNVVVSDNGDADIAAQALIEGGTGLWEAIDDLGSADDLAGAQEEANAYVRKYKTPANRIRMLIHSSDEPLITGLRPGQKININLPTGFSITNLDCLIDTVQFQEVDGMYCVATVEVLSIGEHMEHWTEFMFGGGGGGGVSGVMGATAGDVWMLRIIDTADPVVAGSGSARSGLLSTPYRVSEDLAIQIELLSWTLELTVSGSVTIDIERSDDEGSTWTTIFSTTPSVSGASSSGSASDLSITVLNAMDLLRYSVLSADGTGGGLTFVLRGKRVSI